MSEKLFLSRAAFAAMKGWSPSYVTKLGHQGRLVLCPDEKRLIDVEATLAKLELTGDPRKAYMRQHHLDARIKKYIQSGGPSEDEIPFDANPKYWDAKARREQTMFELAELELARMRSSVVERQRVEIVSGAVGRKVREDFLRLPPQLAPVFATMTDAFEIEVKLRDAFRKVFTDIAKLTPDDLARVLEQSQ